jgi:hypothetical protein
MVRGDRPSGRGRATANDRDDRTPMTVSPLVQVAELDDPRRLAALACTGLVDTAPELTFDRLTRLAGRLLRAPAAFFTLVAADRVFVKSAEGLGEHWRGRSLPSIAHAFSPAVVRTGAPLIVGDTRRTPGLADHPAVVELGVAAYAGVPVSAPDGHLVGGLAVADSEPRAWRDEDVGWLEELAAVARGELERRVVSRRDPAAGLVTPAQFATALAGRLAAAEIRGDVCSLVRLALRGCDHAPPDEPAALARLRATLGEHDLLAFTGDASYALLPGGALDERRARRLALGLARTLAGPGSTGEAAPAWRVAVGTATSRPGARPSPTALMAAAQEVLRAVPARRSPRGR